MLSQEQMASSWNLFILCFSPSLTKKYHGNNANTGLLAIGQHQKNLKALTFYIILLLSATYINIYDGKCWRPPTSSCSRISCLASTAYYNRFAGIHISASPDEYPVCLQRSKGWACQKAKFVNSSRQFSLEFLCTSNTHLSIHLEKTMSNFSAELEPLQWVKRALGLISIVPCYSMSWNIGSKEQPPAVQTFRFSAFFSFLVKTSQYYLFHLPLEFWLNRKNMSQK